MKTPEELFQENKTFPYYILQKHFKALAVNEDFQQIAMLGFWKAARTYKEDKGTKFVTYAAICIQNEIKMTLRRQKYRPQDNVSLIGSTPPGLTRIDPNSYFENIAVAYDPHFDSGLTLKLLLNLIQKRCPTQVAKAIVLELEGYSQKEIAEVLKISQSYVSRLLARGYRLVASEIKERVG